MTKILVTGATGNTGSGLVPTLHQSGVEVRALVHNETKAQPLRDLGVEVVIGDLDQPDTLAPAVDGVDKIYLLPFPTKFGLSQFILTEPGGESVYNGRQACPLK